MGNGKVKTYMNENPISRMVLQIVAVPLIISFVAYVGFRVLTEAHIANLPVHVSEVQSQQIFTIPALVKDIDKIENEIKAQVIANGILSNRVTAVEEGFKSIQLTQSKQDLKLDQIVTILLESKP